MAQRGRPSRFDEDAVLLTCRIVDEARRAALTVALFPPNRALESTVEFPQAVRRIILSARGRHWDYVSDRVWRHWTRSPERARERARLALAHVGKFDTPQDWERVDQLANLRREDFGPAAARALDLEDGGLEAVRVEQPVYLLPPGYVRGISGQLDAWGAARHGVSVKAFQAWRLRLRKQGWPLAAPVRLEYRPHRFRRIK